MHEPRLRASLSATGLVAALTLIVACTGGRPTASPSASPTTPPPSGSPTPTPQPTPTPSPTPSPTPETGQVSHPTGATDVVLRGETGGGFVPFGFLATQAPYFTLYGDNTVIFRPTTDTSGTGFPPFVKAVMNAAQVDALLTFALTQGGLAGARDQYVQGGIADAPSTFFTINAGGIAKRVEINALGIDTSQPNPDAAAYRAFNLLNNLLSDFEAQVRKGQVVSAETYVPAKYRAVLVEGEGMVDVAPWPWADLTLKDFPADKDNSNTRYAGLTPEQAAKVATVPSGGKTGFAVASPDGKVQFSVSIRPLFPGDPVVPDFSGGA